jgi:Ca2+-binding RTX toxin-like protein
MSAFGCDWIVGGAGVDRLFGGAGNDSFVFDVTTSGLDVIFDGVFGAGAGDTVTIVNGPDGLNEFTELMSASLSGWLGVVIAFSASTSVYIKGYVIAQLASR